MSLSGVFAKFLDVTSSPPTCDITPGNLGTPISCLEVSFSYYSCRRTTRKRYGSVLSPALLLVVGAPGRTISPRSDTNYFCLNIHDIISLLCSRYIHCAHSLFRVRLVIKGYRFAENIVWFESHYMYQTSWSVHRRISRFHRRLSRFHKFYWIII